MKNYRDNSYIEILFLKENKYDDNENILREYLKSIYFLN